MGGFAAFATGFVGGLNKQHEEARDLEAEWLTKAGERFDLAYKAKQERDVKNAERERSVAAAMAFTGGDENLARIAVDSKIKLDSAQDWYEFMQRQKKPTRSTPSPVQQQTEQAGMATPSPQDAQNLSQIKPTPTQQEQVPSQAAPQQAQPTGPRKGLAPVPEVFKPVIQAHAERTGLDPALIGAVFMQESGARPEVISGQKVSSAGAMGPMQTRPDTLRDPGYGVTPAKNNSEEELWRVGTDYLAAMMDRYKNIPAALAAYNWGPGNTDKWLASGADPARLPKETSNYISTVVASLKQEAPQPGPTKEAAATLPPSSAKPEMAKLNLAPQQPQEAPEEAPVPASIQAAPQAGETTSSPVQERSGWQKFGDIITGRRDPAEVADRGAVKAGSQYGLSAEESRAIMRGDDIGTERRADPSTRVGFSDKPIDVNGIVETVLQDVGNFADPKVHRFAVELARTDPTAALELADPLAVKAAEEAMKADGAATTAHQTMMQNARALALADGISVGQAVSQLLGQTEVKGDAKGGFARVRNSQGTAQPIQTVDAQGKPTIRVSDQDKAETDKQLMQASEAQINIQQLIEAIEDNPNNIGIKGKGKELLATGGELMGGPLGRWLKEYFDGDEIARIKSMKNLLTGKLMPAITGDTSRYSENDRKMVQEAQGELDAVLASPGGAVASLKLMQEVTRRGAAYALHKNRPNLSEKSLWAVLANNYIAQGKDAETAKDLAAEDIDGLAKYKYGTSYGTE